MKQHTRDELFRAAVYGLAGVGLAQITRPHPLPDFVGTLLGLAGFVGASAAIGVLAARYHRPR